MLSNDIICGVNGIVFLMHIMTPLILVQFIKEFIQYVRLHGMQGYILKASYESPIGEKEQSIVFRFI